MSAPISNKPLALVAIGNALVDILAPATEDFVSSQAKHGMNRGAMNLIGTDRALELYDAMGPATEMSGGSAGNTMAVFASFGGSGGYIGKVGQDQLGGVFAHDLQSMGVRYSTQPSDASPTGRCMILVTPDGERTMNTYLGAAVELSPADLDESMIGNAAVTYLEGYLFDPPKAMEAFYKAADIAHRSAKKVALTLSDSFCVERHREKFLELVEGHVDILFANEDELKALYRTDLEAALQSVSARCDIVAVTRGALGSVIIRNGERVSVAAEKVDSVVDTTGAGDAYAAGFLFGLTEGYPMAESGRFGSVAAAEVISHMGPRPLKRLSDLIERKAA